MRTRALCWAAALALSMVPACRAFAQESESSQKSETQSGSSAEKKAKAWEVMEQYRLDFSINELEDGKKINSRQYSMNLATNQGNEIKIGTRVPIEIKEGETQYMDVGTNIFARINPNITSGQSELRVNAELSNFAVAEQSPEKHPIVRQIKLGGDVLLPPATKTFTIGSADDPNSKREFQLEVTVTKIK